MEFPHCPFWDFSLQIYGKEGVAPACLKLQERHQIDVNILLYCVWAGHSGNRLERGHILALKDAVGEWHGDVVRSLRKARKSMKTVLDGQPPSPLTLALRAHVQKLEIDAEHIEQLRLYAALKTTTGMGADPGIELAKENVSGYLSILNVESNEKDHHDIEVICRPASAIDTGQAGS